jgi:hypothetical protein
MRGSGGSSTWRESSRADVLAAPSIAAVGVGRVAAAVVDSSVAREAAAGTPATEGGRPGDDSFRGGG